MDHPAILESAHHHWPDEAACRAGAEAIAGRRAVRDACIELRGPLGAGKTTFARHLLRALGVQGRIKSPSYAVMEPYALPTGLPIAHFDFYRFDDPREWEDAGFRDVFGAPGLKLVEWPERAGALLPAPDLALHIEPLDASRREVRLDAYSATGMELLGSFSRSREKAGDEGAAPRADPHPDPLPHPKAKPSASSAGEGGSA